MSVVLRTILIVFSILTSIYIGRKIKKSQVQTWDAAYWILISFVLVFMALFPGLMQRLTILCGFESTANFVFLIIIFLQFIRLFLLSIRVSFLEDKMKNLVQEISIRERMNNE